jgi:hypothetical protein
MVRPLLALERLLFLDRAGKVGYRHGENGAELETMDHLEFIARVTSHIPDKGQVMVRYYGLYTNAHRGKIRKASRVPVALGMIEEELSIGPVGVRHSRLWVLDSGLWSGYSFCVMERPDFEPEDGALKPVGKRKFL